MLSIVILSVDFIFCIDIPVEMSVVVLERQEGIVDYLNQLQIFSFWRVETLPNEAKTKYNQNKNLYSHTYKELLSKQRRKHEVYQNYLSIGDYSNVNVSRSIHHSDMHIANPVLKGKTPYHSFEN